MKELQTINIAVILGVFSYSLSRRMGIPAILFYLVAGIVFGPVGFQLLHVEELGNGLLTLTEIAVAIILFEGGLSLTVRGFQKAPSSIGRVLLLSIPLTAVGGTLLGHFILGIGWDLAAVFGTIIVVTGPTVIGPLLKSLNLVHRVEVLLHWESIWGDVAGVLLSAMALQFAFVAGMTNIGDLALTFMLTVIVGIAVGLAVGFVLTSVVMPWVAGIKDPQLPGIIVFASALGTFYGSDILMQSSGPMAAAVAGFFMSYRKDIFLHSIRRFKDQISIIFISTLFVLLSAYSNPLSVMEYWPGMLLTAVALGAVVRPLAIFLSLAGGETDWREKMYIGLIGPRGIVAMAAASYASLAVTGRSTEMALVLNTIFLIIFLSGSAATLFGRPLASVLRLTAPRSRGGILLVGANPFSIKLAEFASRHLAISFLETNKNNCLVLQNREYGSLCTDVLNDDVYEKATEEGFYRLIALTTDDSLNQLICQKAASHLGEPNVYAVRGRRRSGPIMAEPLYDVNVAFSEGFYLAEALEKLRNQKGEFKIIDSIPGDGKNIIPLFKITADNGLEIFTSEAAKDGKLFSFVYRE